MSPEREVSNGELAEDVAKLTNAVVGLQADLAAAVRDLTREIKNEYVPRELYTDHRVRAEADLRALEARLTWIARTAVTALLLPVLAVIIVALISRPIP